MMECYMGTHYAPISCPTRATEQEKQMEMSTSVLSSRRVNIRIHTQMCIQVQGREHKGTKAGRKTNTDGRIFGSVHTLFSTHGQAVTSKDTLKHTHAHTRACRPSMSSSPACVDKYMCVRVCPLRVNHNAQLARRERPECVSVVRSGAPSLSTFSTVQLLFFLSSSLVFNVAFLSLGHILACSSVCQPGLSRRWPFPGFSQCKYTSMQMEIQAEQKKEKEKKRETESKTRLPRTAETHAFRKGHICFLDKAKHKNADILIQYLQIAQQQLAWFTRSHTSPCPPSAGHVSCER